MIQCSKAPEITVNIYLFPHTCDLGSLGGTPLLRFYSLWHGSRVHNPEDEEEDDQNQESGRQVLGLIHFALVSFTRVSLQINFD